MLEAKREDQPITFFDSVTGKPLFRAPVGRTVEEFLEVVLFTIAITFLGVSISWMAQFSRCRGLSVLSKFFSSPSGDLGKYEMPTEWRSGVY